MDLRIPCVPDGGWALFTFPCQTVQLRSQHSDMRPGGGRLEGEALGVTSGSTREIGYFTHTGIQTVSCS